MVFRTTWNTSYEATPPDSQAKSQGAQRIRELKQDVRERLEIDHVYGGASDSDSGKHKKITLVEQGSDPTTAANEAAIYAKDVSGVTELFWRAPSNGTVTQMTVNGAPFSPTPIGSIIGWFSSTPPTGYIGLLGQTIGDVSSGASDENAEYEDLYTHIWNSLADAEAPVESGRGASAAADWAAGKYITLPDSRGASPIGAGSGGSLTARTTGDTGGAETHTLTQGEMPAHTHGVSTSSGAPGGGAQPYAGPGTNQLSTSTGGGGAHNNMHPWLARYEVIKYKHV